MMKFLITRPTQNVLAVVGLGHQKIYSPRSSDKMYSPRTSSFPVLILAQVLYIDQGRERECPVLRSPTHYIDL